VAQDPLCQVLYLEDKQPRDDGFCITYTLLAIRNTENYSKNQEFFHIGASACHACRMIHAITHEKRPKKSAFLLSNENATLDYRLYFQIRQSYQLKRYYHLPDS